MFSFNCFLQQKYANRTGIWNEFDTWNLASLTIESLANSSEEKANWNLVSQGKATSSTSQIWISIVCCNFNIFAHERCALIVRKVSYVIHNVIELKRAKCHCFSHQTCNVMHHPRKLKGIEHSDNTLYFLFFLLWFWNGFIVKITWIYNYVAFALFYKKLVFFPLLCECARPYGNSAYFRYQVTWCHSQWE